MACYVSMPLLLLFLTMATAAARSCDPPHFFTGVNILLANSNRTGESAMRDQRHRVAVLYNNVPCCASSQAPGCVWSARSRSDSLSARPPSGDPSDAAFFTCSQYGAALSQIQSNIAARRPTWVVADSHWCEGRGVVWKRNALSLNSACVGCVDARQSLNCKQLLRSLLIP